MPQCEATAKRVERVHGLLRLPRLSVEVEREMRTEKERFAILGAHAAVQRRPLPLEAGVPCIAEEIEVVPPDAGPCLLLRAVPHTERDLLMLGLGNGDAYRYVRYVTHLFFARLDIGELKKLETIELSLAFAHLPARVDVAGLECELTPDHVLAHAHLSVYCDWSEPGKNAGHGVKHQTSLPRACLFLSDRDVRVGVAVVSQFVQRPFTGCPSDQSIEWSIDAQPDRFLQPATVGFRQYVEARQLDRGHTDGLSFRNVDSDGNFVLCVVQRDVERRDARVRKTTVAIEDLDAFEVRLERAPIEVSFPSPWDPRAASRLEGVLQRTFINLHHA